MGYTKAQRRGQAWLISRNIETEAAELAAKEGISQVEAIERVFADPEAMDRCHNVPRVKEINPEWREPE